MVGSCRSLLTREREKNCNCCRVCGSTSPRRCRMRSISCCRICSAFCRMLTMTGLTAKTRHCAIKLPNSSFIMRSTLGISRRRAARALSRSPCNWSASVRWTPGIRPTAASTSRGTAMSRRMRGRSGRWDTAVCTISAVITAWGAPVALITTSAAASAAGSSSQGRATRPYFWAKATARCGLRLMRVMFCAFRARSRLSASCPISPKPTIRQRRPDKSPNVLCAWAIARLLTLIGLWLMPVSLRARLPARMAPRNSSVKRGPMVLADTAVM